MATFVIAGAGLTGAKAAETLRAEGFDGRVVIVGAEPDLPYERPPLSKGYLLGQDDRASVFVHDEKWYVDQGIEVLTGRRVTALDRAAHEVELAGGERLGYTKLLLAWSSPAGSHRAITTAWSPAATPRRSTRSG